MSSYERCGAPAEDGPCTLPAGHNMGRVNIPSNHRRDLDHVPITQWRAEDDRSGLDELAEMIKTARDRARWLAVHRRMGLARVVEGSLDVLYLLVVDMRGRYARKEPV